MDPNKIIGAFAVVIAPVVLTTEFVHNAKKKVVNKIDEVQCELKNRRDFDKKHDFVRKYKENKKK